MEYHISPMMRYAMLEQIDSLPGAQRKPAFVYGNGQVCLCERGAYVRRHVVRAFHGMAIEPLVFWSDAREEVVQVADYVGVSVLLNYERGGSMLHEYRKQTGAHSALFHPGRDLPSYVVQTFAACGDRDLPGELLQFPAAGLTTHPSCN